MSFKEIVDDCKDFFEESGFSHVQNKSSAAKLVSYACSSFNGFFLKYLMNKFSLKFTGQM